MKTKPKDIQVNLPAVHLFQSEDEMALFAYAINTIIHGKVKVKYDELGTLGGQSVGLFYIQRNHESQILHDEFMRLIEAEEIGSLEMPEEEPSTFSWACFSGGLEQDNASAIKAGDTMLFPRVDGGTSAEIISVSKDLVSYRYADGRQFHQPHDWFLNEIDSGNIIHPNPNPEPMEYDNEYWDCKMCKSQSPVENLWGDDQTCQNCGAKQAIIAHPDDFARGGEADDWWS